MSIKKYAFLVALMAVSTGSAYAAEMNAGIIHFTGLIIEPSCTIEGDSGTDQTVPLGTYPTTLFTTPGTESELVPFTITLVDCPLKSDGLPNVQLTFNGPTTLTESNTLMDVSQITTSAGQAAEGMGIAISPADDATIFIAMDGTEGQAYIELPVRVEDKISMDFNARYKSFADAKDIKAGAADGDLTVNILYR